MPYLLVQTNQKIAPAEQAAALGKLSKITAELLGKSERYVMVALQPDTPLLFAGDSRPVAYLELKSIGLPVERTAELSQGLCQAVEDLLGVPGERVYIEFADAARPLWGWNGRTF
ncbi:MAG TPA: hypothetical protein ENJ19_12210 [Gammaproteobacteria bacterium]|nr:hypothetical protein [Gammaproteobacteria bacterium]